MRKNILVFKHMKSQNPGIFRDFAGSESISFHEVDLHAGEQIPELKSVVDITDHSFSDNAFYKP